MTGARRPEAVAAACAAGGAPVDMVDVILGLDAPALPEGFEPHLYQALARLVPWIAAEPCAGIHPLRGVRGPDGSLLLAKRTKLVVRMPRDKICAASVLEGTSLDVAGVRLRLGQGTYRRLAPASTLYAVRVVTGDGDEASFLARVGGEMEQLAVRGELLCGRRSDLTREGRQVAAWSLAVHELSGDDSLVLQRRGLGLMRDIGCGIFAPHKTIHTAD